MTEPAFDFTEEEIQQMLDNLDVYTAEEVAEIDRLVDELDARRRNQAAYDDLIEFCKRMQPDFIVGKHHRILADMLMDIEQGNKDRICVNIPPRHGKSNLVSIMYPAWFLGRNPNKTVMMVSHTTDLAVVYTNTEGAVDADKIEEQIKTSFRAMTTPQRVSKIYQTKHWNYFAHVDGTQLKSGFYDKLEALQGQHSTYYAGALLNFEDVEKVMEYSKKLVCEHFPRRS